MLPQCPLHEGICGKTHANRPILMLFVDKEGETMHTLCWHDYILSNIGNTKTILAD